ncbi:MAG TPA: pilus assembly protein TadG-related protein [Candidatus Eisenbacteria bacterium]
MIAPTDRAPRHGEEGIALIYVAVFLLVSLWFVSLAIDMGKIMAAKTELQAAADAAALAGASAIDPLTGETVQDSARVRAALTASQNKALEQVKTPVIIDPMVDVEFPADRQVRVTVHRDTAHDNPVLLQFAQTLGIPSVGVHANATAEASPLTSVCEGLAPFAPEMPPYGDFSKDCDSVYTLKTGVGNSMQGNFQLLDYPTCDEGPPPQGGGGAEVKYYIINGWDCCLKIGDLVEVDTQPGAKVGPVRQGMDARWNADTDHAQGICYEQYTGNGQRVFLCPIIKDFNVNGKKTVQILKFAAFFLKDKPQDLDKQGIHAQFIDYIAPGDAGDVPPDSTSVYGVHLIE